MIQIFSSKDRVPSRVFFFKGYDRGGMAKPGPKKVPLKILKNRGSWLAKTRTDVEVKRGIPQRPRGLNAVAKRHWDIIVPQIADMGVLAAVDWPKLRQM